MLYVYFLFCLIIIKNIPFVLHKYIMTVENGMVVKIYIYGIFGYDIC